MYGYKQLIFKYGEIRASKELREIYITSFDSLKTQMLVRKGFDKISIVLNDSDESKVIESSSSESVGDGSFKD